FAQEGRDIDVLRPVQFGVERKRRNLDFVLELFEAGHAAQLNRLRDHPIGPKRAIGNSKVQAVTHRPNAANFRRRDVAEGTIFFALQMQASRRNLIQMNFHAASFFEVQITAATFPNSGLNFFASASATSDGTNAEASPPSLAISFTIRELR